MGRAPSDPLCTMPVQLVRAQAHPMPVLPLSSRGDEVGPDLEKHLALAGDPGPVGPCLARDGEKEKRTLKSERE